ncbi:hypothetical protein NM208_g6211 [Fusarium decemcellulare]|uniref:Uncharacterized protein n=1 Tax=Fusarium decemcellulare TaxID=57161 RepID=A0ACC1SDU8_9HYPO|nr:hypothetical protein NM208_g6211 [Fusarium decemcellulare]
MSTTDWQSMKGENNVFGVTLSPYKFALGAAGSSTGEGALFYFPEGWHGVMMSAGPHAHSAWDLTCFFKAIFADDGWRRDPATLATFWVDVPKRQLKIGSWEGTSGNPVFPLILRALRNAAAALKTAGHEVVSLQTPKGAETFACPDIYVRSLRVDTKATLMQFLDDAEAEILPAMKKKMR